MRYFLYLFFACTACTHEISHHIQKSSLDQIIDDNVFEEDEVDIDQEQLVM